MQKTKIVEKVDNFQEPDILTERVSRRKDEYVAAKPILCPERSRLFRESWEETEGEPIDIRFAEALRKILEGVPVTIREDELIVGSQTPYIRGLYAWPEFAADLYIRELGETTIKSTSETVETDVTEEVRNSILEDARYWKGRCIDSRIRNAEQKIWGDKMRDLYMAGVFTPRPYQDQPAGSMCVKYGEVLLKGLNGIIAEATEELNTAEVLRGQALHKAQFLRGVIIACEAVVKYAERHAELARQLAARESSPRRKNELERISGICDWVPANPARSFYEAVQSFWFIQLVLHLEVSALGISPGRFDQYMYPFYARDIGLGRLTPSEAGELLGCLWVKFQEIEVYRSSNVREYGQASTFQNITIGGVTKEGKDATNDLTHLILETARQVKTSTPHISLRCHSGMSEDLWVHAVETNRDVGAGIPAFFNDKVALLGMCSNWGISLKEARDWVITVCVRRHMPGSSSEFGNHFFNNAKVLELTLNNGVDPRTKKQVGPKTGDPRKFTSFDEFKEAFLRQLSYAMEMTFAAQEVSLVARGDNYRIPFTSALMDDCMKKGMDALCGGQRYRGDMERTIYTYGYQNTADSLVAIKKLVFEDEVITMAGLLGALATDFEGDGKRDLRHQLLLAPKYGNDDDYADRMLCDLYRWTRDIAGRTTNQWGQTGLLAAGGASIHYHFGKVTGPLPDGRKAWEPLADAALSPMRGMDRKGPTAVLNSAVKVDAIGLEASILNQKFSPSLLQSRAGIQKFISLIKSYFDRYGYHVQFNIIDTQVLIEAKAHPEKYRDLLVRVAGYSAFFVELAPQVQDDIIARTQQAL